jgi:CheY-like chemotaxis protein
MTGEAILVIDDNPTNQKLLKVLLTVVGYNVRTALDAEEALTILEEFTPQLILTDLQLPGMDGLALVRILKQNPKLVGVVIIAVTAYAMKGDLEKALAAGCDGYITKPIDLKTFQEQVATYLSAKPKNSQDN